MKKVIFVLAVIATGGSAFRTSDAPKEKVYKVNTTESVVTWEGTKPTGVHTGTINVSAGELMLDAKGHIAGGSFNMDMNSLKDTDMQPGKGKENLEGHLKTGDFFEVEKYPMGKFVITKVVATPKAAATHEVTGNLTLKDKTKEVSFPATIHVANGKVTASVPKFYINRTDWGINFHSGITGTLQDKLIHDAVGLSIKLVAN